MTQKKREALNYLLEKTYLLCLQNIHSLKLYHAVSFTSSVVSLNRIKVYRFGIRVYES